MTRIFTDQMGRQLEIEFPPQRIISLVPSQTELLYDLGLDAEVVGQTLFCIHPEAMHRSKPSVGGTKKYKPEVIRQLAPGLIIGNKEENDREGIEALAQEYPVWMSDIENLEDAIEMIRSIGELVNKKEKAEEIITGIRKGFEKLAASVNNNQARVAYFIWRDPWMTAGHDTFINDMLKRCGMVNVMADETSRYPGVSGSRIAELSPEVILLSSEPYPFKEKHIAELQALVPDARIMLVDGELFSWYGSRLLRSPDYFIKILSSLQGVG
jgi:ABC-type Fe3+-hydroxamate transport system substrate-binding protein